MPAKSKKDKQPTTKKKVPQRPGPKPPKKLLEQAEKRKGGNKPVKCDVRGCQEWFRDRQRLTHHKIRCHGKRGTAAQRKSMKSGDDGYASTSCCAKLLTKSGVRKHESKPCPELRKLALKNAAVLR